MAQIRYVNGVFNTAVDTANAPINRGRSLPTYLLGVAREDATNSYTAGQVMGRLFLAKKVRWGSRT